MNARMVELDVLRYDPEADSEPHFQRYAVPCAEEWVVLDALNAIKESIDPTLNYRWSCHMPVEPTCWLAQYSNCIRHFPPPPTPGSR